MRMIRSLALLTVLPTVAIADPADQIVGAIRWDAWTGGSITKQVERTRGPDGTPDTSRLDAIRKVLVENNQSP